MSDSKALICPLKVGKVKSRPNLDSWKTCVFLMCLFLIPVVKIKGGTMTVLHSDAPNFRLSLFLHTEISFYFLTNT